MIVDLQKRVKQQRNLVVYFLLFSLWAFGLSAKEITVGYHFIAAITFVCGCRLAYDAFVFFKMMRETKEYLRWAEEIKCSQRDSR